VYFTGIYLDPRFTNSANTRFVDHVLLMDGGVWFKFKQVRVEVSAFNLPSRLHPVL